MKALIAVFIFTAAYVLIATEKMNKTIVAILGASLVLLLKLVSFEEAVHAVDFNVIFLLVGMMTCVHVLSKTGFFEWTAISVAKKARGEPILIMVFLVAVTGVLSAFLDNVTTIVLIVPVTILIMQLLEISPAPFVILEAIASNIGGTATLIGDPPNIVIGSQAGLSFMDFLIHLTPVIGIVFLAFIVTMVLVFRNKFNVPNAIKQRLNDAIPSLAIIDRKNMIRSLIVLAGIFVGFFFHEALGLEPGIVALAGSMIMLLVCHSESDETFMRVEWGVVFFFIGMFMMISALEVNGVISWIGDHVLRSAGTNLFAVVIIILWGSALFSSILDNIPFVITMIPLIKQVIEFFAVELGITDPAVIHVQIAQPLWWALALGACLGGNATLIGASANIVMSKISERNHCPISFKRFFKYGFFFTIQSVFISMIYLWLRYFVALGR